MKQQKLTLWKEEEYSYPLSFGFLPNLMTYLHDESAESTQKNRPCMIVVPGGGYCVVSPTEGEIVAKAFYEMGYQAFVLTYTVNTLVKTPLLDQPMKDLSRAIRYVRRHADALHIDPSRVAVCGFSAGGHLCASVCVHYRDVNDASTLYQEFSNRPDAAILSYPVITSGPFSHEGSFHALLGAKSDAQTGKTVCTASAELLNYMSLEKHVTETTPPCFLWQTATDELVPVENSYLFAQALKEHGIPYAHHVFSQGKHGLSLANDAWANHEYGEPYTLEQIYRLIDALQTGKIDAAESVKEQLTRQFYPDESKGESMYIGQEPNKEAAIWPLLANEWLKTVFHSNL